MQNKRQTTLGFEMNGQGGRGGDLIPVHVTLFDHPTFTKSRRVVFLFHFNSFRSLLSPSAHRHLSLALMTPRTSAVPLIVAPRNPAWQPFEILPRYADPSGQLVPGSSSTQPLPPDTVIDGLPLQYRLAYNPLLPLSAYSPLLSPPNISHLPFFQPVTSLPKEAHHRKAIEKLAKRLARAGFRMRSAASGRSYTTYPTGGEGDDGDADEGNYLEAILPPVLVQWVFFHSGEEPS